MKRDDRYKWAVIGSVSLFGLGVPVAANGLPLIGSLLLSASVILGLVAVSEFDQ